MTRAQHAWLRRPTALPVAADIRALEERRGQAAGGSVLSRGDWDLQVIDGDMVMMLAC